METNKETGAFRRQWPLLIVAGALFATAGMLYTNLLHPQPAATSLNDERLSQNDLDSISRNPAANEKARQARLEKANKLREHWKYWAAQHRKLLSEMAQAKPGEYETLKRVFDALPAKPGKDPNMTGVISSDFRGPGTRYTWNPFIKAVITPTDPVNRAHDQQGKTFIMDRAREDFNKYRDFRLSESENPGRHSMTLWASGRITETTTLAHSTPGKPVYYDSAPREIAPPFDFINRR